MKGNIAVGVLESREAPRSSYW